MNELQNKLMKLNERQHKIMTILRAKAIEENDNIIRIDEKSFHECYKFDVSVSTLSRDFEKLEKLKFINRDYRKKPKPKKNGDKYYFEKILYIKIISKFYMIPERLHETSCIEVSDARTSDATVLPDEKEPQNASVLTTVACKFLTKKHVSSVNEEDGIEVLSEAITASPQTGKQGKIGEEAITASPPLPTSLSTQVIKELPVDEEDIIHEKRIINHKIPTPNRKNIETIVVLDPELRQELRELMKNKNNKKAVKS